MSTLRKLFIGFAIVFIWAGSGLWHPVEYSGTRGGITEAHAIPPGGFHSKDKMDPETTRDPGNMLGVYDDWLAVCGNEYSMIDPGCQSLTDVIELLDRTVRFVFVTSQTFDGDLVSAAAALESSEFEGTDGILAGDYICQYLAENADVPLPGTYMAWLSDATRSPSSRFDTSFTGPYVLTTGTAIAYDWADLIDGSLNASIYYDENAISMYPIAAHAWTNTFSIGTPGGSSGCISWTSAESSLPSSLVGYTNSYGSQWTNNGSETCDWSFHLYCFQQ